MKIKKVSKDNSGTIKTNLRRFIIVGTIVYTILVLYFMFLGFNRTDARINYSEYTFILIPEVIPLRDGISKEYPFKVDRVNPWIYATCGIPDGEEYKGSVTILVNGEELFQFSGKDEDRNIHKMKTFYNAELKEMKIIVTGNAKVWDVGIAKIKHWWE